MNREELPGEPKKQCHHRQRQRAREDIELLPPLSPPYLLPSSLLLWKFLLHVVRTGDSLRRSPSGMGYYFGWGGGGEFEEEEEAVLHG